MASFALSATDTILVSNGEGEPFAGRCGEALPVGAVAIKNSSGVWVLGDASALATAGARDKVAIVVAETNAANQTALLCKPLAEFDTTGLTQGLPYFLSATAAGQLCLLTDVDTANGYMTLVGFARSATRFVFNPFALGVTV